jgi:hypothetical protein
MARIYASASGNKAIQTPPFAERPLKEILELLNISGSEKWSSAGPIATDLAYAGSFVQIEVERSEGEGVGWQDGWHLIRLTPDEAQDRLALIHQ